MPAQISLCPSCTMHIPCLQLHLCLAIRNFFSRTNSTLFNQISIAEFYSKTTDRGSTFVHFTVCGRSRAAKFYFAMEMEVALWRTSQAERWMSNILRTRGWRPGRTKKDSKRWQVLGTVNMGRHLSLPHCCPCISLARLTSGSGILFPSLQFSWVSHQPRVWDLHYLL